MENGERWESEGGKAKRRSERKSRRKNGMQWDAKGMGWGRDGDGMGMGWERDGIQQHPFRRHTTNTTTLSHPQNTNCKTSHSMNDANLTPKTAPDSSQRQLQ
uniref:Uncharacterized protein n=1 Tax=Pseudictyota dubia TaxID=2749911 RepID=A0A7R9ZEU9_9STRA|mmetsp:Transcript_42481/g.78566  ORF Transcript_42481/g.78566 Transcript_42481/m.78566 type:complete len:102 (+) Transcript_42481:75-380(+)